jgi:hypothetical protein
MQNEVRRKAVHFIGEMKRRKRRYDLFNFHAQFAAFLPG